MKKQCNLNVVSLLALILLVALVSIAPASSIETPLNESAFNTGFSHQAITVTIVNNFNFRKF